VLTEKVDRNFWVELLEEEVGQTINGRRLYTWYSKCEIERHNSNKFQSKYKVKFASNHQYFLVVNFEDVNLSPNHVYGIAFNHCKRLGY